MSKPMTLAAFDMAIEQELVNAQSGIKDFERRFAINQPNAMTLSGRLFEAVAAEDVFRSAQHWRGRGLLPRERLDEIENHAMTPISSGANPTELLMAVATQQAYLRLWEMMRRVKT